MIKLIKSSFYNETDIKRKLADFILRTKRFSMDAECAKFEKRFAKKQGRKYAVLVNSGSSANLILIQALLNMGKIKKGAEVGFSTLTWATNVMPLMQLGLEPIPIDCETSSLNVSPATLRPHLKDIKALFVTNVLGFCDDLKRIKQLCDQHGIILLEDNCESLGSAAYGKSLGNFGLASTFSFFVGHHLSTIEGGMVCTDNKALYNKLVKARAHGWDRNLDRKRKKELKNKHKITDFYQKYTFYDPAYNVRPTEIQGFLGNIQLNFLDDIILKRENNFRDFQSATKNNPKILPLNMDHMDRISNFAYPLIFKDKKNCEKYKKIFMKRGIEIRPIIAGNITRQPFFRKYIKKQTNLPNSDFIHVCGFYFGNNPEMTDKEIDAIKKLLK
ncbi:MAG: DegT/DnrJ/EryC1/StrS family aminotransferase [Candidatus Falkowbacteria bacterium]